MTTKTATKTISGELIRRSKARDEAHAKTRAARDRRNAWEQETENLRAELTVYCREHPWETEGPTQIPKEGTKAAKLRDALRARISKGNPHEAEYAEERDAFHGLDQALQDFKRRRVRDRTDELDTERAEELIHEGWNLVREGCRLYQGVAEQARAIVIDTPGLTGQHYGYDPRPLEWLKVADAAVEALEDGLHRPGLSPYAAERWAIEFGQEVGS